jgi:hypothetical protein
MFTLKTAFGLPTVFAIDIYEEPHTNEDLCEEEHRPHIDLCEEERRPHMDLCEEERRPHMDLCEEERRPHMDLYGEYGPYSRLIRDADGDFYLMSPVRSGFHTTGEYVAMLLRYSNSQDARSPSFRKKRPTPILIQLAQDDSILNSKGGVCVKDHFALHKHESAT